MTNVLRAKLMVTGDSAVGKTSIVQQFLNSGAAFPKNYSMTLSADILTRTINIPESQDTVELIIVDCSGKEINNDIIKKVIKSRERNVLIRSPLFQLTEGCSLIMSVFDVTRDESLAAAKTWIETVREWSEVTNMPGVIIGNKTDLTERRSVPAKVGLDTATALKVQYLECSAKDNVGVEDPFFYLANEFHKLHADQASTMAHIA